MTRARNPERASDPRWTEIGNGERVARMFGHELRFIATRGQWLAWDGRRWCRDGSAAEVRAKRVAAQLFSDAGELAKLAAEDPEHYGARAKSCMAWATTSSKANSVRAMLAMARSEAPIAAAADAFDRDAFAFNVQNGTIDLRTGELRTHRPEDMITMLAPTIYVPAAAAPVWERFLERVLPDAGVRAWVQRYMGYALTGDVREQVLAFAHGTGANGKSVLLDVMLGVVGDYGLRAAAELVLAKLGEAHPTEVAALESKRLVVASEIEQGRAWAESTIKRVTGDTTITARRMRQDFYTFGATHKLVIAANTRPKVHGTDHAIWRRMRLVPFEVTIPEAERDKSLVAKLIASEGPGILAWAVRGCLAWQREGLAAPAVVTAATAGYRADQDVLGHWIEEECVVMPAAFTPTSDLYASYRAWCERTGREAWTKDTMRDRLLERDGITETRRDHGRVRGLAGIGIRSDRGAGR